MPEHASVLQLFLMIEKIGNPEVFKLKLIVGCSSKIFLVFKGGGWYCTELPIHCDANKSGLKKFQESMDRMSSVQQLWSAKM